MNRDISSKFTVTWHKNEVLPKYNISYTLPKFGFFGNVLMDFGGELLSYKFIPEINRTILGLVSDQMSLPEMSSSEVVVILSIYEFKF